VPGDRAAELPGKPASIVESHRGATFVDVVATASAVYAVTTGGFLCSFHPESASIVGYVNLEARAGYSLSVQPTGGLRPLIAVGCSSGLVRLFEAGSLKYVLTLPHPPPVAHMNFASVDELARLTEQQGGGSDLASEASLASTVDGSSGTSTAQAAGKLKYPACLALRWLPRSAKPPRGSVGSVASQLVAIYGDRSLLVWDISCQAQALHAAPEDSVASSSSLAAGMTVGKYRSFLFHSACIWDLQIIPAAPSRAVDGAPPGPSSGVESPLRPKPRCLPGLVTCSADNTVRLWTLDTGGGGASSSSGGGVRGGGPTAAPSPNFFSRDMVHALFTHPPETRSPGVAVEECVGNSVVIDELPDLEAPSRVVNRCSPRCLAVAPNGSEIACGDRKGNVKIWSLAASQNHAPQPPSSSTPPYRLLYDAAAHDAEVFSLHYSPTPPTPPSEAKSLANILVSGGRDRLIHLLGREHDGEYRLLESQEYHTAAVSSVRFSLDGKRLFSCGTDKILTLSRVLAPGPENTTPSEGSPMNLVHLYRSIPLNQGMAYDMNTDRTGKYIITTGGEDKLLHIYSATSGKHVRCYSADLEPAADAGKGASGSSELYKLAICPGGMYTATCSFDKWIRLFDFYSGACIAQVAGHAELVTGLKFTPDGKRLISIGGDGCIFVWKLNSAIARGIQEREKEIEAQHALRRQKAQEVKDTATELAAPPAGSGSSGEESCGEPASSPERSQMPFAGMGQGHLTTGAQTVPRPPSPSEGDAGVDREDEVADPPALPLPPVLATGTLSDHGSPGIAGDENFRLNTPVPPWAAAGQAGAGDGKESLVAPVGAPGSAEAPQPTGEDAGGNVKPQLKGKWASRVEEEGGSYDVLGKYRLEPNEGLQKTLTKPQAELDEAQTVRSLTMAGYDGVPAEEEQKQSSGETPAPNVADLSSLQVHEAGALQRDVEDDAESDDTDWLQEDVVSSQCDLQLPNADELLDVDVGEPSPVFAEDQDVRESFSNSFRKRRKEAETANPGDGACAAPGPAPGGGAEAASPAQGAVQELPPSPGTIEAEGSVAGPLAAGTPPEAADGQEETIPAAPSPPGQQRREKPRPTELNLETEDGQEQPLSPPRRCFTSGANAEFSTPRVKLRGGPSFNDQRGSVNTSSGQRTLSQERERLRTRDKRRETAAAVESMREQLQSMGFLPSPESAGTEERRTSPTKTSPSPDDFAPPSRPAPNSPPMSTPSKEQGAPAPGTATHLSLEAAAGTASALPRPLDDYRQSLQKLEDAMREAATMYSELQRHTQDVMSEPSPAQGVGSLLHEYQTTWNVLGSIVLERHSLEKAIAPHSPTSSQSSSSELGPILSSSVPELYFDRKYGKPGVPVDRQSAESITSQSASLVSGSVQTLPTIFERSASSGSGLEDSLASSPSKASAVGTGTNSSTSAASPASPTPEVSAILEKYSEMLIGMFHDKMLKSVSPHASIGSSLAAGGGEGGTEAREIGSSRQEGDRQA